MFCKEITCLLFFKSTCIEPINQYILPCWYNYQCFDYRGQIVHQLGHLNQGLDIQLGYQQKRRICFTGKFHLVAISPISHDWQAINREHHIPLSYWTAYFKYHTGSASVVILSLALTIFFIQEKKKKKQVIFLSILRRSFQKLTETDTNLEHNSIGC